jgi:hypothetical protein
MNRWASPSPIGKIRTLLSWEGLPRFVSCGGSSPWGDLDQIPIRTRCSPTSTSRGRSERRGESVDQVDHDRVHGLTVIGVRGRTRRARVGGYLGWLPWCSGKMCTGLAARLRWPIEQAAGSRAPAGLVQSLATAGAQHPVRDVVTVALQVIAVADGLSGKDGAAQVPVPPAVRAVVPGAAAPRPSRWYHRDGLACPVGFDSPQLH